jgi:O-antigen biosynthesis protein
LQKHYGITTRHKGDNVNSNESVPNTMFKPIKVIDIELNRPFTDIECMHGYEFIQALVRLHGTPIGSAKIPLIDGYCSASVLSKIILKKHNQAIIRHLLHDRLMAPSQSGDLHISHLLDIPHAVYNGCLPLVTVAVCTRNRTHDLARCLDSLNHLNYPYLDILIVDNAPDDNATEQLLRTKYPHVRYIPEPRPGLNWARNRAIAEARGEIIAYTDDDVVVDPEWVRALAEVFADDSEVMAITGLVVPYELETDAQILFEQHGGFGRGFERKWYHINRENSAKVTSRYGHTGRFGTGANMAYRRILFDYIGCFDPALDVGTVTNGGGDLEMFFRVLKEGYLLVYEPGALVRHCHRRELEQLRAQIATWGTGSQSYFVRSVLAYPDERFAIIRLELQKLCNKYIRYLILLFIRKMYNTRKVFLTELRIAETHTFLRGLFRYQKAHRTAVEIASVYGPIKQTHTPKTPIQKTTIPHTSNAIAVRIIDINHPLHALTDITNYNHVRVFVTRDGIPLGTIDIANYRKPVGVTRLRDAIVENLYSKLSGLNDSNSQSQIQTTPLSTLIRLYSSTEDQPITMRAKLSTNVPVSIIVKTHGTSDGLRDCLRCLGNQESSRYVDITVLNNNPDTNLAASIVAEFSGITLVNEFHKGQAYAFHKEFVTNKGDIIIVIDDMVIMPADWMEKLIAPFSRSDVMIVTGNALPQELETTAQILFEKHFGVVRSFEPKEADGDWFKSFRRNAVPIWDLGSMTNVAFRTSIFNHPQIDLTDETLNMSTSVDYVTYHYLCYRVLKAGYTLMYEPSAFVWYKYPKDMPSLYRWLYHHSKGHVVYQFTTLIRDHDLRALSQLMIKIPEMHFFRFVRRLYGKNKYPLSFLAIEATGNLTGLFTLFKKIRYDKHKDNNKPSLSVSGIYQSEKIYHTDTEGDAVKCQ